MKSVRILVVEDSQEKLRAIVSCLLQVHPITLDDISDCRDVVEAKRLLSQKYFDLLIVDIAIPLRRDSEVIRDGGLRLLAAISAREAYRVPSHVVGLTAHDDLMPVSSAAFGELNWTVLRYSESDENWRRQLQAKAAHVVLDVQRRLDDRSYESDLAILCALEEPELRSVRQIVGWEWEPVAVPGDATRYHRCELRAGERTLTLYAAAAPRMGMPAAAVMATKMIELFRPRYVGMTGITAGVRGAVNLGDLVVADPSWNYESGKLRGEGAGSVFHPEPHQYHLSTVLRERFREMADDDEFLARTRKRWPGPKPDSGLQIVIGPLASGSSVLADASRLRDIAEQQNRKVVAVDMEAYSIFAAADEALSPKPEPFCIKGVCDFADELKNDAFQAYAAYVSAQVLRHLVEKQAGGTPANSRS